METSKNMLTKKERAQLRAALLWIWFVKNIKVFIWGLFILCVALTCMGIIQEDTPFLGTVFGNISRAFRGLTSNLEGDYTLWTVVEATISLGFIVALAATNIDRIALKDIKSKKIKILLVKAGLYFDKNGKLTKRIEVITNTDVDGDGKIDNAPETIDADETLLEQIKRTGEELKTIVSVDLTEIDEDGNIVPNETKKKKEEKEDSDEVADNFFIIIWRKIVKFFKMTFKNVKMVQDMDQPDEVNSAVFESMDDIVNNHMEEVLTETDTVTEVNVIEGYSDTLETPKTTQETTTETTSTPEVSTNMDNPQDALAALLGRK